MIDEKALAAAVLAAPGTTIEECRAIAEPIVRAYLQALSNGSTGETDGWARREDGVDEILADYSKFINDRPMLTSLLYDIDMLPEQCVTHAGAIRLAGLCEVWKKGEAGELPSSPGMLAAAGGENG